MKKHHLENKQLHPRIRKVIEATKETNRKLLETKPAEQIEQNPVPAEHEDYSDRIQELINKTKEQLKG